MRKSSIIKRKVYTHNILTIGRKCLLHTLTHKRL